MQWRSSTPQDSRERSAASSEQIVRQLVNRSEAVEGFMSHGLVDDLVNMPTLHSKFSTTLDTPSTWATAF